MPVVANRFYPGNPGALQSTLDTLVPNIAVDRKKKVAAVVAPHAGYVYSGAVAGEVFSQVIIPETVVILGPNHHGRGKPLALGTVDWEMPLGTVTIEKKLAKAILRHSSIITEDEVAHQHEHSLEVQVPFIQYLNKNAQIVPIVVSHISFADCRQAAQDLAAAIREFGKPVLLVASTDMSHYESRTVASKKDRPALERVEAMDPRGLYDYVVGSRISMCGVMPTTIVLLTAMELGAKRAELTRYTDSGEASGDIDQVVGYAGMLIQ
jgi:AmmeMemoRadiSam system protein B